MQRPARILGWLLLAAIAFATVAPIGLRPQMDVSVSLQRFGAFAVIGFLFAYGYPRHRSLVIVLTVAAAGLLEASQVLQPSRHGRVPDFLVKAAGCSFGALAALAATQLQGIVSQVIPAHRG